MTIYVVRGSTGEYSDRKEWPVVAYTSEDAAKEHVVNATREAKEWEAGNDRYDLKAGDLKYDPACDRMDYTGNLYWYERVDLKGETK